MERNGVLGDRAIREVFDRVPNLSAELGIDADYLLAEKPAPAARGQKYAHELGRDAFARAFKLPDGRVLTAHELGRGAFARAFKLPDGRVLKLTTDEHDAIAAHRALKGGARRGIPNVYGVYRLPQRSVAGVESSHDDAFAIIVEHIEPLSELASDPSSSRDPMYIITSALMDVRDAVGADEAIEEAIEEATARAEAAGLRDLFEDLLSGWLWLYENGVDISDLSLANVGAVERDGGIQGVILDFGFFSVRRSRSADDIPMATNPGRTTQARKCFDECLDIVCNQVGNIQVELRENDERAAQDNGAGSERQFGYCVDGKPIVIAFASKVERLPLNRVLGLMRHEFGHALDFAFGKSDLEWKLGRKLPRGGERRADVIAEAVFGEPIEYDERDIQCVACGGKTPRPKRLASNP